MAEKLYKMGLHDWISDGNIKILRVAGGWVYYSDYYLNNPVFIPFDNEFMEASK